MADTTEEAIESAVLEPIKRARAGDAETEVQSIKDQIAGDQYLASKRAASAGNGLFGMRTRIGVPPGGG